MIVALAIIELHIPAAASLKDKRRVVKSLVERLHQRLRVSVAETALHDLHQRAEIGVAVVSRAESEAHHLLDQVRAMADQQAEAMLVRWDSQILEETL
jgi:hypothetical protein